MVHEPAYLQKTIEMIIHNMTTRQNLIVWRGQVNPLHAGTKPTGL